MNKTAKRFGLIMMLVSIILAILSFFLLYLKVTYPIYVIQLILFITSIIGSIIYSSNSENKSIINYVNKIALIVVIFGILLGITHEGINVVEREESNYYNTHV